MLGKLQCVVLDCPDVLEVAQFYQSLLGGVVNQPDPRFHLDVEVADLDQAAAHVLGLGGTLLHVDPRGWRVFADPAGHPFCLLPGPPS